MRISFPFQGDAELWCLILPTLAINTQQEENRQLQWVPDGMHPRTR